MTPASAPLDLPRLTALLREVDVRGHRFVVDVDETLLQTHEAFIRAKEQCVAACKTLIPGLTTQVVLDTYDPIDTARLRLLGYTPERFAGSLALTLEALAQNAGVPVSPAARDAIEAAGRVVPEWTYPPFPGALETLAALKAAGAWVALCTKASDRAFQEQKLDRWGLRDLVHHVVIAPQKTPAEIAAARDAITALAGPSYLADHPGWMIGDSLRDDVSGANALGMCSVHVRHEPDPTREIKVWSYEAGFEHVVPTHTVARVADVPALIAQVLAPSRGRLTRIPAR